MCVATRELEVDLASSSMKINRVSFVIVTLSCVVHSFVLGQGEGEGGKGFDVRAAECEHK